MQPIIDIPTFESHGCEVNAIGVDDLFDQYQRLGFLYPEKWQKLAPYMEIVAENWHRALLAGEDILKIVTYQQAACFASLCILRTTSRGWIGQHLVSNNVIASRAVLLASQAMLHQESTCESAQNWFRPNNKYAFKVFGTGARRIGQEHYHVQTYNYLMLGQPFAARRPASLQVVRAGPGERQALCELAARTRGKVYPEAEELHDDLELRRVDERYRRVGLSRTRSIWLAYGRGHAKPIGGALAYRGPLGLNLSMIENRCDLHVDPNLADSEASAVSLALMQAVSGSGIYTVLHYLTHTGFDPFVGRKLFALACAAGLKDIDVRVESYHLFAGKIDSENLKLWELKLDIARPAIARALGGAEAAAHSKRRFLEYLQREDTLTYSVIFTVTGIKPY